MLLVAGDHEEFSLIKVVDEAAAAAAWLNCRIKFVLSGQDDGASAFNAASSLSHGILRRGNGYLSSCTKVYMHVQKCTSLYKRKIFQRRGRNHPIFMPTTILPVDGCLIRISSGSR